MNSLRLLLVLVFIFPSMVVGLLADELPVTARQPHPSPQPRGGTLVTVRTSTNNAAKSDKATDDKAKKPKTIQEITAGNKRFDGLFTFFQDQTNGSVHLLI